MGESTLFTIGQPRVGGGNRQVAKTKLLISKTKCTYGFDDSCYKEGSDAGVFNGFLPGFPVAVLQLELLVQKLARWLWYVNSAETQSTHRTSKTIGKKMLIVPGHKEKLSIYKQYKK